MKTLDIVTLASVTGGKGGKQQQPPSCGPSIAIGSNNGNGKIKVNSNSSKQNSENNTGAGWFGGLSLPSLPFMGGK